MSVSVRIVISVLKPVLFVAGEYKSVFKLLELNTTPVNAVNVADSLCRGREGAWPLKREVWEV